MVWVYYVMTSDVNQEEPKLFYAPSLEIAFLLARARWPNANTWKNLGTMEK